MSLALLRQQLAEIVDGTRPGTPGLATGYSTLDAALPNGGLPRGRLTELVGAPGSGKTTVVRRMVEQVVPGARLVDAVKRCVDNIVEGTPKSVRAQKRLMRRGERLPLDEAVQAGIDAFAESVGEGEHIAPMTAFVNRKKKG